jgi:putative endonuclease
MERLYYVYILASQRNGTLYVGVTNDIARRVFEHRTGATPGFTAKYDVKILVWYEVHPSIAEAIAREKRLKRWKRSWKIKLIEENNPQWLDIYERLNQ